MRNPTVVNLDAQVSALKNNLIQNLNSLLASKEITLATLNREDERLSSKIYSTPQKERLVKDITRQQNIKESLYLYLLEREKKQQ